MLSENLIAQQFHYLRSSRNCSLLNFFIESFCSGCLSHLFYWHWEALSSSTTSILAELFYLSKRKRKKKVLFFSITLYTLYYIILTYDSDITLTRQELVIMIIEIMSFFLKLSKKNVAFLWKIFNEGMRLQSLCMNSNKQFFHRSYLRLRQYIFCLVGQEIEDGPY